MSIVAVPARAPEPASDGLRRELSTWGAVAMIVGIVIGSGIFLGSNRVADGAGSPWLIVLAWTIGGLLTLMGALTYAELGVLFPKAGGEYVFLREGMGPFLAFLSGWTSFTINLAGSGAALAVVFAEQLNALKPEGFAPFFDGHPDWSVKLTAIALILFLSVVNYFGIRFGGNVQKTLALLKGTLIILLAAAALLYLDAPASPIPGFFEDGNVDGSRSEDGFSLGGFFGLALVAVLFAYDGWTNVTRIGSEIKDPARSLPRAMLLGTLAVAALYIAISLGYLNVLGMEGFAHGLDGEPNVDGVGDDRTVASNVAHVLFGSGGRNLVAAMILVSVFGSLNGITISGPRIYYAMARDRLFPNVFGKTNRHQVPAAAIWAQAGIAILFLLFFDFNELTDSVVFISFLFYALAAIALMVLRRTRPDLPRPYKVPGYPVVPALFILASLTFVGYLVYDQFVNFSLSNLSRFAAFAVVLLGIPVYLFYRGKEQRLAQAARSD